MSGLSWTPLLPSNIQVVCGFKEQNHPLMISWLAAKEQLLPCFINGNRVTHFQGINCLSKQINLKKTLTSVWPIAEECFIDRIPPLSSDNMSWFTELITEVLSLKILCWLNIFQYTQTLVGLILGHYLDAWSHLLTSLSALSTWEYLVLMQFHLLYLWNREQPNPEAPNHYWCY